MLLVDLDYYNMYNFGYYSAYVNAPLIFSVLVTRNYKDWLDRRDYLLESEYALTKETGDLGPPSTTYMDPSIRQMLADGALPFVPVTQFRLPDGSASILYRNTQLTGP